MLTDEMVTAVIREGGFDVTAANVSSATILSWINEKYRELVTASKWRRGVRELGPTVAGQAQYPVPDGVVDIERLRVGGGRPWLVAGIQDIWEIAGGNGSYSRTPGLFAVTYTDDGTDAAVFELYPVPSEAGVSISGLCVVQPAPLVAGVGSSPAVPEDTHQGIVSGAIGIGLSRIYEQPSAAAAKENEFQDAVQKLSRRANSRIGTGAGRIRVVR